MEEKKIKKNLYLRVLIYIIFSVINVLLAIPIYKCGFTGYPCYRTATLNIILFSIIPIIEIIILLKDKNNKNLKKLFALIIIFIFIISYGLIRKFYVDSKQNEAMYKNCMVAFNCKCYDETCDCNYCKDEKCSSLGNIKCKNIN